MPGLAGHGAGKYVHQIGLADALALAVTLGVCDCRHRDRDSRSRDVRHLGLHRAFDRDLDQALEYSVIMHVYFLYLHRFPGRDFVLSSCCHYGIFLSKLQMALEMVGCLL